MTEVQDEADRRAGVHFKWTIIVFLFCVFAAIGTAYRLIHEIWPWEEESYQAYQGATLILGKMDRQDFQSDQLFPRLESQSKSPGEVLLLQPSDVREQIIKAYAKGSRTYADFRPTLEDIQAQAKEELGEDAAVRAYSQYIYALKWRK